MTDSEGESEENEPEPEELNPVAILEGLKKKSSGNANVTNRVEKVDSIYSESPVDVKIGIDCAVAHSPSPIETGIDRAFVPMEISNGRDDSDLKDSIGPSNIFKKIRQEKLRKYEED
jgi:hypothetical protein